MFDVDHPLSPGQWEKVREIYEQALEDPASDRMMLALERCEGDSRIESEIRNLLSASERKGSFLNEPALVAMRLDEEVRTERDIEPGTVLSGRFRIGKLVNTGGMGSVYEAWDAELEETVALKTIRPELASQKLVIERFKEEVKQARCISHPNICRVYDLFFHAGDSGLRVWFLTMQFLEGVTLQERLTEAGPIPRNTALQLIEQLIAGLAAAHELGVVHRDFKSSNVILVPATGRSERAVITDFGLAMRTPELDADVSRHRAQGTPAYVPPEQWYEGEISPAGDQYSLGVVMCEMLTGERPVPPQRRPGSALPARLPKSKKLNVRLQKTICRCLEANPKDRFGSVTEILSALGIVRRRRLMRVLLAAGSALVVLFSMALGLAGHGGPMVRDLKQLTPAMDFSVSPSFSRDGSIIAYASDRAGHGGSDIWVQRLPDGLPMRVTKDSAGNDDPTLSPDGKSVVFTAAHDHGGIFLSDVANGGNERLLVRAGKNPQFSPRGDAILYWSGDENLAVPSGRIYVLDLASGKSTRLASSFRDARSPIWNSDGRHVLFSGCASGEAPLPACWDWWVTTVDGAPPVQTGARTRLDRKGLTLMGQIGGWYDDEVLFNAAFGLSVHLWQETVSLKDLKASGDPEEITPGDAREAVYSSVMAGNNLLAFTNLSAAIHVWQIDENSRFVKFSPSFRVTEDADLDIDPNISMNGRWLAFARGLAKDRSIWIKDMITREEKKVPAPGPDKFSPIIDDSGTTIAYESWQDGVPSIYLLSPRTNLPILICTGCRTPTGWYNQSADLLMADTTMSRVDLYRAASGQRETILSKAGAHVSEATWSPVNQMLLFTVGADGPAGRVYAARFPATANLPQTSWIPITGPDETAKTPRWSADGKMVFYISNRDNYWCIWGQRFDPIVGKPMGKPFPVQHYHALNLSISGVSDHSLNLSVGNRSIYVNVAEMNSTIWTGKISREPRFRWFRPF